MYKSKCEWVDGTTKKRYHVGDKVDLPEATIQEMLNLGMIEEVEKKIERSTKEPKETANFTYKEAKKGK
jgi:hypothetical protein